MVGDNDSLLSLPLDAFFLKRLVQMGRVTPIASRWNLYSHIITHRLYEHRPSRQHTSRNGHGTSSLTTLARVCYEAIACEPPIWSTIPYDCWSGRDRGNEFARLATIGLLDLAWDRPDAVGPNAILPHAVLQEYFAARWVSANPEERKRVLRECWNPKWTGVIVFLAGREGERLLQDLYPGREQDNVLHSRLLLAARCCAELPPDTHTERRIMAHLIRAGRCTPYEFRAAIAAAKLRIEQARRRAWSLVLRAPSDGLHGHEDALRCAFKDELREFSGMPPAGQTPRSLNAYLICRHLASGVWFYLVRVPIKSLLRTFISNGGAFEIERVAFALRERRAELSEEQVNEIISYHRGADDRARELALRVVPALSEMLTDDDVLGIIRELKNPSWAFTAWRSLRAMHSRLSEQHIDALLGLLFDGEAVNGEHLVDIFRAPRNRRFSTTHVQRCVQVLHRHRRRVQGQAAALLEGLGGRLSSEGIALILGLLEDRRLHDHVIPAAASMAPHISRRSVRHILSLIRRTPTSSRGELMYRSFEYLKEWLSPADVASALECVQARDETVGALCGCAWAAGHMSDEQRWQVIRECECYIAADWERDAMADALMIIGRHLNASQRRYVIKRSLEMPLGALPLLLCQANCDGRDIETLSAHLGDRPSGWWIPYALYETLHGIHESTGRVRGEPLTIKR